LKIKFRKLFVSLKYCQKKQYFNVIVIRDAYAEDVYTTWAHLIKSILRYHGNLKNTISKKTLLKFLHAVYTEKILIIINQHPGGDHRGDSPLART